MAIDLNLLITIEFGFGLLLFVSGSLAIAGYAVFTDDNEKNDRFGFIFVTAASIMFLIAAYQMYIYYSSGAAAQPTASVPIPGLMGGFLNRFQTFVKDKKVSGTQKLEGMKNPFGFVSSGLANVKH
jgi:hypothetical protein